MRTLLITGAAILTLAGAGLLIPIQNEAHSAPAARKTPPPDTAAPAPARPLSLLFIHHSVGAGLLASAEGSSDSPPGGGLRVLLTQAGYRVHTATYGSKLGEKTDLFDWPGKFSERMAEILTTADGTASLPAGQRHDVVMFKSCFPNNQLGKHGAPPGNPLGPDLTLENAKAALRALLPEFQKQPRTLFVYLTIPPLAPKTTPERLWKWAAKAVLGRSSRVKLEEYGAASRELNDWVVSSDGWLKDYPLKNVAVIDYYDMLTKHGASNLLAFPGDDPSDSHPSGAGQRQVAPAVLAALNHAVARSGVGESPAASPTITN